ncbi:hypothetical protein OIU79_024071 [Salix purpurea]|uniref:Uncharacterized protein n=1 Tax=Salix purpurea TaxID=77065 RepID=A0A9Q0WA08_SALPP|nr:hypothetical protein OIU79_024071 [Salix purpurea]
MQCLQHKVETLSSRTPKDEALKLSKSKKSKPEVSDLNGESSSRGTAVSRSDSASHSAGNRHLAAAEMQRQRLKKLMEEMNEEGNRHLSLMNAAGKCTVNCRDKCLYIFPSSFFIA